MSTPTGGAAVKSLEDCIAFNRAHRNEEMPYFEQEFFERAQKKGALTAKVYLDARARCVKLSRAEGIDAVIAKHKVDAIVAAMSKVPGVYVLDREMDADHNRSVVTLAGDPDAIAEAAFMTGLERNADVVRMASYAPLLAHVDAWQWTPDDFGLPPCSLAELRVTGAEESAGVIRSILEGGSGPATDIVLANAAAALIAAERAAMPREGVRLAREALVNGNASRILQELRAATS